MGPKRALLMAALYAVAGVVWIVGSDLALRLADPASGPFFLGSVLKGLAFVAFTGVVLFVLLIKLGRAQEARYAALFDQHPTAMVLFDPATGGVVDVNPAAAKLFGVSRERAGSMSYRALDPALGGIDWSGTPRAGVITLGAQDRAKQRDVLVFSAPVLLGGRKLQFAAVMDADEATALLESEYRFRHAVHEAPLPMVVHAEDGEVLTVNRAWTEITGFRVEEFPTMQELVARVSGDGERALKAISRTYGYDTRQNDGLFPIHCADGSERLWDFTSVGLGRWADDRRVALSMAFDVTERERTARDLRDREAFYRAITEQSLVGVYVVDRDRVVYANPRLEEIFGYGAGETIGRPVTDFIAPQDRAMVADVVRRRIDGEVDEAHYQTRGLRKDGSEIVIAVHGAAAIVNGRRQIVGVMQDISARVEAERDVQRYLAQLEDTLLDTASAMSRIVEMRDPYTAGHEQAVGDLAAAIAEEMGLDADVQRGLRIAGALHDIGKTAVPAEILTRPGAISEVEYALIQRHAQSGYEVLAGIDFPWPVAEVAREHHERLDGSGYPRSLKGDEIRLESRIVAVADVVEAMSAHRPYRPSIGVDKALEEIGKGRGRLYDAAAVDACLRLFREKGYSLPQSGMAARSPGPA